MRRLLAFLTVVLIAACGRAPRPTTPSPTVARPSETGTASWYGPGFNGRQTASGEVYDQNAMTAAHKTLPLGTRVRVTNVQNERSVEVRINDRGPFVGNRIIDLSLAAAKALDMVGPGTATVLIEVLESPSPLSAIPAKLQYTVQIGSFTKRETAESLRDRVSRVSSEASIVTVTIGSATYHRVNVGVFTDRAAADAEARRLKQAGFDAIVVQIQ